MYVCICNAVSDRDIRAALDRGVRSLDQLSFELGVGAGCGCCRDVAREYISGNCGVEEDTECRATRRCSRSSTAS